MQRYGQARLVSGLDQDYVTPMLPVLEPPRVLKGPYRSLSGNGGQSRHYAGTSTSRTSIVRGM
jgi:hypothetical protein